MISRQLQPGTLMRKGDYRILRTLGKGGMGVIYLAENLQAFGRLCVIKEMLDYFDPANAREVASARKRFEDEARTLAQLRHRGIPNILAYFSEGTHNYIVMEYVEGMSLEQAVSRLEQNDQVVAGQSLSQKEIVKIGLQLCDILEYLATFTPPVVHHDIKPANIILDQSNGMVRLVDFGTAKARVMSQAGAQVGAQKSSIYGTAGYAPPEQWNGKSEVRSDVYALAATLYHLLTDDDPGTHTFKFPELKRLPFALQTALRKALTEKVEQRANATEFKEALTAALPSPPRKTLAHNRLDPSDPASVISNKEELWQWCDKNWAAALKSLANGQLEQCLQFIGQSELAQKAAHCQQMADANRALEQLLRACGAPPPDKWQSNALDIEGDLGYGLLPKLGKKPKSLTFQLLNRSQRGYLHGYLEPIAHWLHIPQPTFGCLPTQLATIELQPDYQAKQRKSILWHEALFDLVIE